MVLGIMVVNSIGNVLVMYCFICLFTMFRNYGG
jgi:hypothetical protein